MMEPKYELGEVVWAVDRRGDKYKYFMFPIEIVSRVVEEELDKSMPKRYYYDCFGTKYPEERLFSSKDEARTYQVGAQVGLDKEYKSGESIGGK